MRVGVKKNYLDFPKRLNRCNELLLSRNARDFPPEWGRDEAGVAVCVKFFLAYM